MARIRTVKPEIRTSLTVAGWPREVRYAWVLLWGYLDDKGRGIDNAALLVADLFPLDRDVTEKKMVGWVTVWERDGCVCRYEVDGRRYLHARNWDHQRINRPTPSRIPPCPIHEGSPAPPGRLTESSVSDSVSPPGVITEGSLHARKEQGAGSEEEEQGAGIPATPGTASPTAQTLVAEWIDACPDRPPGRVVGHVAREVGKLLDEGIPYADVRNGLRSWHHKRLNPAAIASEVHALRLGPPPPAPRPSTTDRAVGDALDLAARLRETEQAGADPTPAIGA